MALSKDAKRAAIGAALKDLDAMLSAMTVERARERKKKPKEEKPKPAAAPARHDDDMMDEE